MIKTTFGALDIGDEFYYANHGDIGWPSSYLRKKLRCSCSCYITDPNTGLYVRKYEIVYIKEKKMTEKEQAIRQVKKLEVEIAKMKKIIEKPERIKVPDCIDIGKWGHKLRILFNDKKQCLHQHDGCYVVSQDSCGYIRGTDLYLEPCEREDLKPGDVAYMSDRSSPNFTRRDMYHCILDGSDYAYTEGGDVSTSSASYTYCWKVVK